MSHSSEITSFIQRVQTLPKQPGISLDDALQPSLDDEAELRKLFATDQQNTRLSDEHVGLIDVFEAPGDIRTIRARVAKDEEDLYAKYVMPLPEGDRKKDGEQAIVPDLDEFKKNWAVFTEGSLSQLLDWNNIVAAGGSVLACLTPLPESAKVSKRAMRKYYHSNAYPTSDVDLFLYGMTPDEAEVKITKIYEAVRDSVPWDVTCVRTKHTVSIHSQYPYRSVQIVLRLYKSPAEILAGFDIDSACFAYDGSRVWGNPRAVVAMMRQCNTVDMSRRSPSYEVRLAKYSSRSFEVYVPTLNRADVDPTIYERAISRVEGLARLLVFEKLKDANSRMQFLEARRALRGRPDAARRYRRKKQLKGDIKADMAIGGLEMNDYDVQSLHIPYGPGWDARRIEKLVYETDLAMNSPFNPKNKDRRLHRHPAFFGTSEECLQDCCEFCPEPIDEDERKLQKEEDEQYIRGRISFIEEDPGRQSISGSFKPIDVGEWSEQVYIGPTEKFFAAIVAGDLSAVTKMLEEGTDPTRRDHVGRMPLHVAILAKQADIACHLIDNGARITSRLADGRTALHLAARMDMAGVVKKLLEKSKVNAELLKKEEDKNGDVEMKDAAPERPSSEDDWTSDDNGVISVDEDMADVEDDGEDEDKDEDDDDGGDEKEDDDDGGDDADGSDNGSSANSDDQPPQTPDNAGELPEDENDEPDVFDINAPDWDLALTPIDYAVLFASTPVIDILLNAEGIDLSIATQGKQYGAPALHPLTITMYREDEGQASEILERLVAAGASCSNADKEGITLLAQLIMANKTQLVLTLLRVDPNAMAALNYPSLSSDWYSPEAVFPIVRAIEVGNYAMISAMIAYGARLEYKEEDVSNAWDDLKKDSNRDAPENRLNMAIQVIESALANQSDLVQLFVSLDVPVDAATRQSLGKYVSKSDKMSLLEWVQFALNYAKQQIQEKDDRLKELMKEDSKDSKIQNPTPWQSFALRHISPDQDELTPEQLAEKKEELDTTYDPWIQRKAYFSDVERLLVSRTSKTYKDIYPKDEDAPEPRTYGTPSKPAAIEGEEEKTTTPLIKYGLLDNTSWSSRGNYVPQHQVAKYEELFEACFNGDNATIQRLCLPSETPSEENRPLQITVQLIHPTDKYHETGLTPLSVAIARRHWDTAKLVFTISGAQYKPDGKEPKFRINLDGFHDDSDDEGSDGDSEASDDTVDRPPIDFMDVAKRPSQVKVPVPPSKMLDDVSYYYYPKNDARSRTGSTNLITAAIEETDLEAFTNIFNLYKLSDPPVKLENSDMENFLEAIISKDSVEFLDEFIRKTGRGITVISAHEGEKDGEGHDTLKAANDKNKVYYGLNVHGKKRKDLAKKSDPNATDDTDDSEHHPLVWRAASVSSFKIVEYLKSDRPLEAYRYYSMCSSDERAIAIRRTNDLEKVLPQWLGWTINVMGESPLSSTILTKKLALVKQMFAHDPKLAGLALKENIKFTGYNLLMVAVQHGCSPKMVDFLLSNGLSPVQTDSIRGSNLFHIIAYYTGDAHLFEHLLGKLPRDVSEALLLQQTKRQFNTPLMVAVGCSRKEIVRLILTFSKASIAVRDINGSFPLHNAVSESCLEITKMLIEASPSELLHSENGVGDTPIEIITSKSLLSRIQSQNASCNTLRSNFIEGSRTLARIDVEHLEKDIPELRKMVAGLVKDGKLSKDSHLEKECLAFARYLETQLASAKPGYETMKKRKEDKAQKEKAKQEEERKEARKEESYSVIIENDKHDLEATLKIVREAVAARPGERKLVHLLDVQKSVQGDLEKLKITTPRNPEDHEDGLEPEEDKDTELRKRSLIFERTNIGDIDPFLL